MSSSNIIQAWKDAEYRASLGAEALALLPGHPAGWLELADPGLDPAASLRGLRVQTAIKAGYQPTGDCESAICS